MMLRRPFEGNSTGGMKAPSPKEMAAEKERRKFIEQVARQRLAGKMRDKRKGPKARINPPERSRSVPTRLPRYDRMKGM